MKRKSAPLPPPIVADDDDADAENNTPAKRARDDAALLEAHDAVAAHDGSQPPAPLFGDETVRVVTRHGALLTRLLVCCVRLGDECTLDFTRDAMTVRQLSSNRTAFVELVVPAASFDHYALAKDSVSLTIQEKQVRQLANLAKDDGKKKKAAGSKWLDLFWRHRAEPDFLSARVVDAEGGLVFALNLCDPLDSVAFSTSRYRHAMRVRLDASAFARFIGQQEKTKMLFVEFEPSEQRLRCIGRATSGTRTRIDSHTTVASMERLLGARADDELVFDDAYSLEVLLLANGFCSQAGEIALSFGRSAAADAPPPPPLLLQFAIEANAKPFASASALVVVRTDDE